jgi:hypothetical protein
MSKPLLLHAFPHDCLKVSWGLQMFPGSSFLDVPGEPTGKTFLAALTGSQSDPDISESGLPLFFRVCLSG